MIKLYSKINCSLAPSDGRCVVVAPWTLGKKPMQKTRRPKTVSRLKGKKGSKDEDN